MSKGILSISLKAAVDRNNTRAERQHWHKHKRMWTVLGWN